LKVRKSLEITFHKDKSKVSPFLCRKINPSMSYSTNKFTFLLFFAFLINFQISNAQTLGDAIYMPRKSTCTGVLYSNDTWSKYWEGTLNRTNGNIGTVTTQSATLMANYGVRNRLNIIAMLPYIKTEASAGTLTGLKGIQDLTLAFKYKLLTKRIAKGDASLNLIGGASTPVTNYVADFLPMSIGMHCKTAFGRVLVNYLADKHLNISAYGSYTARGNVSLDRTSYYTTQQIEATEAIVPDVANFGAVVGFYRYRWQADLHFDRTQCIDGNDIRRQDMPFFSNKMEATRVGISAGYRIKALKDLQVVGAVYQTIAGRNAGQSTTYSVGLMKAFGAYK
jgi:hypothetical protein